jgi:hypothetical protein
MWRRPKFSLKFGQQYFCILRCSAVFISGKSLALSLHLNFVISHENNRQRSSDENGGVLLNSWGHFTVWGWSSPTFPRPSDGYYSRVSGGINAAEGFSVGSQSQGPPPGGRIQNRVTEFYFSCRSKYLTVFSLDKSSHFVLWSIGVSEIGRKQFRRPGRMSGSCQRTSDTHCQYEKVTGNIRDFLEQNNVTEKYHFQVKTQFFENSILIPIIWVMTWQVGLNRRCSKIALVDC